MLNLYTTFTKFAETPRKLQVLRKDRNHVSYPQAKPVGTFYILLTVHHVMILGKWPTWCTIFFLCIYLYF